MPRQVREGRVNLVAHSLMLLRYDSLRADVFEPLGGVSLDQQRRGFPA
jgi:hypothetical protein